MVTKAAKAHSAASEASRKAIFARRFEVRELITFPPTLEGADRDGPRLSVL
ncbi:hypothetical protein GCM10028775_72150 [Catellatospora paridis]